MAEVVLVAGCHLWVGCAGELDLEGGHKVDRQVLDEDCGWCGRLEMYVFDVFVRLDGE